MIGLGILGAAAGAFGGLWLAVVGFFVDLRRPKAEEGGLRVRVAVSGREAGRLMSFPAVTIPAGASVAEAVEDFFVRYRYSAFPVMDGDRLVGLVDLAAVERVPAGRRSSTSVGQIALHDPSLVIDEHQDVAELMERPAFQETGRAIVLMPGRRRGGHLDHRRQAGAAGARPRVGGRVIAALRRLTGVPNRRGDRRNVPPVARSRRRPTA